MRNREMQGEFADDLLSLSLSTGQSRKRRRAEGGSPSPLLQLLLLSASAADRGDFASALQSLLRLCPRLSLSGDPFQRVAAQFSDAILSTIFSSSPPSSPQEEFAAFASLYRASPYFQFAHFTANQAIVEAFEAEAPRNGGSLHVVDFDVDVSYGFQWPSLMQSLADKATAEDPIELRITGFGRSRAELKETEARLSGFAKGCRNLCFQFQGKGRGEVDTLQDLTLKQNSTVVVNAVFSFHMLKGSTLQSVKLLNPSLVVLVEREGEAAARPSFLSRFVESLQHFAAVFDSLGECMSAESKERLKIERNYLGREIRKVVERKGEDDEEVLVKFGRLEAWRGAMERSGFEGVKMSSRSVSQAKLLLKMKSHSSGLEEERGGGAAGFRIFEREEGRGISLGWQEKYLVTATAWKCSSN